MGSTALIRSDRSFLPELSGTQKVAVLCMALGSDAAAKITQKLNQDEVDAISFEIARMERVEGGTVERPNDDGSVDRFELRPGDVMRGRDGTIRHMVRNVGTTRFANVIVEQKGTRLELGG